MRRTVHSTDQARLTATERRNRRERSFLIQAFMICLSLFVEVLLFHFAPWLAERNAVDWYWISLLLGWITILNSSINPVVYIIFNPIIRRIVWELLGIKKPVALVRAPALEFNVLAEHRRPRLAAYKAGRYL